MAMTMFMRRKPILVLAIGIFWLGYVSFSVTQYFYKMGQMVVDDNLRRLNAVDYHLYAAAPLLAEGQLEPLIENLKRAAETKEFDFYILTQVKNKREGEGGGEGEGEGVESGNTEPIQVLDFYNPGGTVEDLARLEFPLGFFRVDTPESSARGKAIQVGHLKLAMGVNMNGSLFIVKALAFQKWDFIQDFVVVTTFLGFLLYLILKDILDLTRVLQTRDRKQVRKIKARSQEAHTLLTVAHQYEKTNQDLQLTNQTYAGSLSPAIRHELLLGTQAPHVFEALVVRLDVNGYTQMFLDKKDEFVTSILNRYFKRAAEVIQRYDGHIYQYVGDEIVFHFKIPSTSAPTSTSESTSAATSTSKSTSTSTSTPTSSPTIDHSTLQKTVSCVRSLFALAQEMDEDLKPQGVPFIVKAAIAKGRLRFIHLDTGFAFAGLPLIESVRMLGKIDEKKHNLLALYSDEYDGVSSLVQVYKRLDVAFKGFSGQTEIIEIKNFIPVHEFLHQKDWDSLSLFRSDQDLIALFEYLQEQLKISGSPPHHLSISHHASPNLFLKLYHQIRHWPMGQVGPSVAQAYGAFLEKLNFWVETCVGRGKQQIDVDKNWNKVLASYIALGGHLLKSRALEDRIRTIMEHNLNHVDQRVRGNTVLALDELSPETYSFHELLNEPMNRVAADVLMAQGRRDFSGKIFHKIKEFLFSDQPFFIASGLYVLSYLYHHHRAHDHIYFKANPHLQQIPTLLKEFLHHENDMVRKRAQISIALIKNDQTQLVA